MAVRGIRGATTVEADTEAEIVEATRQLLEELISLNDIDPAEVAGAWFTTTRDIAAEFPAVAARQLGWVDVPLLCGHEMDVSGANPRSIPHCIRVLIQINTDRPASAMKSVYQRRAGVIKQDLDEHRRRLSGESL